MAEPSDTTPLSVLFTSPFTLTVELSAVTPLPFSAVTLPPTDTVESVASIPFTPPVTFPSTVTVLLSSAEIPGEDVPDVFTSPVSCTSSPEASIPEDVLSSSLLS